MGGPGGAGGALPACNLSDSGPLLVNQPGAVVENLRIQSQNEPGLRITADHVIVRDLILEHEGAPGIVVENAEGVRIENVSILHRGAPDSGPNESKLWDNIFCENSPSLTVTRARLEKGSSGVFLEGCADAKLSWLEGHDFRGPANHGQFVRFNNSDRGSLTDFSVINPETAWTENNVHAQGSSDVYIARGLVDGNNGPNSHGVLFSGTGAYGLVEDVDAIRMGNGCFSTYTGDEGTTFRRTRCRENICADQGRGEPASGGIMWSADNSLSDIRIEDSVYFADCGGGPSWPNSAFSTLDLREEDFALRPALELSFCFDQ